jgi:hypothetical protein
LVRGLNLRPPPFAGRWSFPYQDYFFAMSKKKGSGSKENSLIDKFKKLISSSQYDRHVHNYYNTRKKIDKIHVELRKIAEYNSKQDEIMKILDRIHFLERAKLPLKQEIEKLQKLYPSS